MTPMQVLMDEFIELKAERNALERSLREAHPEVYERLDSLKHKLGGMEEELRAELRRSGKSITMGDYMFQVVVPHTTRIRTEELVQRASERGEVDALVQLGFLIYTAVPEQVDRLPGQMRAVYAGYIEKVAGTPRVTLPKNFGA